MHEFDLRLVGHPSPPGQVLAHDVAALASAMQTLCIRLAKVAADRTGPGRSESTLEALSRVRLVALNAGSTHLAFTLGDADALPMEDPIGSAVSREFWTIAEAIKSGVRPDNVNDTVSGAVSDFVRALAHAAPIVEFAGPDGDRVSLRMGDVDRGVWEPRTDHDLTDVTYRGRLEMLDLGTSTFAIRDVSGNRIKLKEVRDAHAAARLVDRLVAATGTPVRTTSGELRHVEEVDISADDTPAEWSEPTADLAAILAAAPVPSESGGVDVTDDEFADFLAAIKR